MTQERATALRLAPGRVFSAAYEKKGGIWRYSVNVEQIGNVQDIGSDGRTGSVVENKSERAHDHDHD